MIFNKLLLLCLVRNNNNYYYFAFERRRCGGIIKLSKIFDATMMAIRFYYACTFMIL